MDNEIFLKYFPATGVPGGEVPANSVKRVFEAIIGGNTEKCSKTLGEVTISKDFKDEDGELSCLYDHNMAETRDENNEKVVILCAPGLAHGLIDRTTEGSPPAVTCDTIGDRTSWQMATLGQILLHEYTHINDLTEDILGQSTVDGFGDEDYYGPFLTQSIASKPGAVHIADSYAWFAGEAYWSHHCNKKFGSAQKGDAEDKICGGQPCDEAQAAEGSD